MMVIFAILGSLFSGKKKEQKGMPPFNNKNKPAKTFQFPFEQEESQKRSSTSTKSLEDFANEVFSQLNQKKEQSKTTEELGNAGKKPFVLTVEPENPTVTRQVLDVNRFSNNVSAQARNEMNRGKSRDVIKEKEIGSYVPTTKEAFVQAIIASEIIGPPKSKQR